jgi:pyruvate formate lyase activating enzyme
MEIAGFVPLSLTPCRGQQACVVMTPNCNFRCGYCKHPFLVETPTFLERKSNEWILNLINQELDQLTAVILSGGEPTLQEDLPEFCKRLCEIGIEIILETNGSRPEMLEKLINEKLIDYVAMDLKAPTKKYSGVAKAQPQDIENTLTSKELLIHNGDKIDYEFRTTFVPGVLTQEDLDLIVWGIQHAKRYVLQQFDPGICIEKLFEKKPQPTFAELKEMAEKLKFNGELIVRTDDKEEIINEV